MFWNVQKKHPRVEEFQTHLLLDAPPQEDLVTDTPLLTFRASLVMTTRTLTEQKESISDYSTARKGFSALQRKRRLWQGSD